MGFNINETITTELNYKEIALIAVALGEYQRINKDSASSEILIRARNIVDRLGNEMYDCKQDDDNGH